MKKIIFILTLICLSCHYLFAQVNINGVQVNAELPVLDPVQSGFYKMSTCEEQSLTIDFNNTGAVVNNFEVSFASASDIVVLYHQISNINLSIDPVNHSITVLTLPTGLTTLTLPIKASCAFFNASTNPNPSATTISLSYQQGLASQVLAVNVYSGILDYMFLDDASDNISYVGHRNDIFTRKYNFKVSQNVFFGKFSFQETVPVDINVRSITVRINGVNGGAPLLVVNAFSIDPLTHQFVLEIPLNGIVMNDEIEIFEEVQIIGCPSTQGQVVILTGCESNFCKTLRTMDVVTNQGPESPNLVLEEINPKDFTTCLSGSQNEVLREFRIKNIGYASAINTNLPFVSGAFFSEFPLTIIPYNSNFTVIPSVPSIVVNQVSDYHKSLASARGNTTPTPTGVGDCFDDNLELLTRRDFVIPVLPPGESVIFQWRERTCCVSSDNNKYNMYPTGFQTFSLDNECTGQTYVGWVNTNDDAVISPLSQVELTGTNNMFGCLDCGGAPGCFGNPSGNCSSLTLNNPGASTDFTEELRLKNSGFKISGNNANYGFLPIDMHHFQLVVDVVAEGRLLIAPQAYPGATAGAGNIRLIDQSGILVAGNPRVFTPTSQRALTNGEMLTSFNATDVPDGVRAVFEFDAQDIFDASQISQYAIDGYRNLAYQKKIMDFINALEVRFELSGKCDKSPNNGGSSPYHEKVYLVPDNTCDECMLSIGQYNDAIIVNCPGCEYPGVLTTGYSIERVTVGLPDGDNNGLPDNISNTINSPNLKMVTDNDIFKATTTARLWAGSFRTYGSGTTSGNLNIGSLEQETGLGFTDRFLTNLGRIDFFSAYGSQFTVQVDPLHPITLEYVRGSTNYTFNFTNNALNIWTTDGAGHFLFQFDIGIIRQALQMNYGFTAQQAADFHYESSDQSIISCHYKVLPGFDLGSAVYYDGVDVNTRCFYSNQTKDVNETNTALPNSPYGLSGNYKAADLALMRPYLNYVCEAYGTGFILADLKEKYSFGPDQGGDQNSCFKGLSAIYGTLSDLSGYDENFDLFPFEVRSLRRTDKIEFVIPRGYVIDYQNSTLNTSFSYRYPADYNYTHAHQAKTLDNIRANNSSNIRLIGPYIEGGVTVGDLYEIDFEYHSSLTFKQNSNLPGTQWSREFLTQQERFNDFNEFGKQWLALIFRPDCSQNVLNYVEYSDDDAYKLAANFDFVNHYFVRGPRASVQEINYTLAPPAFNNVNEVIWRNNSSRSWYNKPRINLTVGRPVANVDIYKKTQRVPFTITITEGANLFAYFTSDHQKITFGNLYVNGSSTPYPIVNGVYQLGNSFTVGQQIQLELEVHVICNTIVNDNLNVHVGYVCDNTYPSLLANNQLSATPCAIVSNSIALIETNADMAISYNIPLTSCGKISHALTIRSLQNGGLYDFIANVDLPANLFYQGNPSLAVFHANGTPMQDPNNPSQNLVFTIGDPVVSSGNNLSWDFTALSGLDDVYLSLGDYLLLTFDTEPRCGFTGGDVISNVSAFSYCDKSIVRSLPQPYPLSFTSNCFPFEVVLLADQTVCAGESVVLTASVTVGATTGMTYTWYILNGNTRQYLSGPSAVNTYTYNNITNATTFEVEVNNGQGCIISASRAVTISSPDDCCRYKIGDVSVVCDVLNKPKVCIPITALRNVPNGIIGMDFCMGYNSTIMRPTGVVTLGPVVNHSGYTGRAVANINNPGEVHVTIYYPFGSNTAPDKQFTGTGDVICVEFEILSAGAVMNTAYPVIICQVDGKDELDEAYTLYEKTACWKPGSVTLTYNSTMRARILNPLYPSGANPLGNPIGGGNNGGYPVTANIYSLDASCDINNNVTNITQSNTNGYFTSPLNNGSTQIKILRDVVQSPVRAKGTFMRFVNGFDTQYLYNLTILKKPTPPWYTMVAGDVNMNGDLRGNDLTLLQQRIVEKITEFPQVWNYDMYTGLPLPTYQPSLDWRFIDKTTVDTAPRFKRSTNYPFRSDGSGGYWRDKTPMIDPCLPVYPQCKNDAAPIYYGVLLGDLDKATVSTTIPTNNTLPGQNPNLKLENAYSKLIVDVEHGQYLGNNVYRIPVKHKYNFEYGKALISIDMLMGYDQAKLRINDVSYAYSTTDAAVSMMWNSTDDGYFILTSFTTLDSIAHNAVSYYLDVEKYTNEPFTSEDFGELQFLLNGEPVEARISVGAITTNVDDANQPAINPHITVIPNPAVGQSTIEFAVSNNSNNNRLVITDVLGRIVKSYDGIPEYGVLDLDTHNLAAGMYICTIRGENGFVLTEKFQVKK